MSVESATYISQLNTSYPLDGDIISEGDNHLRLVKGVLQSQFTSLGAAAVTLTAAEMNSVTARSVRAGDTYSGAHNYTGATITVPTAADADSTSKAASTAFVQAAIASVNAQTGVTLSISASTSIAAVAGQHIVCTNAATVTVTLPAAPNSGDTVWITPANGRIDTVIARNGLLIMGLSENLIVDSPYVTVQLRYVNSAIGWRLV